MKDNSFYNKIHRLGRITVVCALISFMAVPFGLAAVNGISMNIPEILKNAIPLLLTFSISGICENLSFMPIIGSGALYMSCVTGNVSNMKVPAAVNAMEVAGYTAGSDRADVVAIIAVAASTFVTTAIVFLGMLFLAPLFEPIYNNAFLRHKMGMASAQAWVLFIIVCALTGIAFVSQKKWVYYSDEDGR